jgi:hypothetical protein
MSTAKDYGAIIKTLVHDTELLTLMGVATADRTNYSKLTTQYILQTIVSDALTTTSCCRLLVHSAPSLETNNSYVLRDSLIIEVFVPNSMDSVAGFQRRSNQIVDRLIEIFNRNRINDRQFRLVTRHELASSTQNYLRQYVQFIYKKSYS